MFTIPPEAVRFEKVEYWFVARAGRTILSRVPGSGTFNVPVENRVSVLLRTPDGAALEGAMWRIQLLDTSRAPSGLIDIAQGVTDSEGRVSASLPALPAVLRAAAFNGGIANFHLEAYLARGGNAYYVVEGFFANYSEPEHGAMTSGSSMGLGDSVVAEVAEPIYATEASCPRESWRVPDPDSRDDGIAGTKWGYVAQVHSVFGMTSTYTYGNKAETASEFAVQVNGNPWRASGSLGSSVHNVNEREVTAKVYPKSPNAHDSRMELLQVKFNMEWLHAQEYESISGTCMRYNKKYPTTWIPWTIRTNGVRINSVPDDCFSTCTVAPGLNTRVEPDKGVGTGAQRANYFSASICIVVCLGAQSGYTAFSRIDMSMSTSCRMWWVYFDGQVPPHAAPLLYVDAGEPEDKKVGTYPAGCEPLPL